MDDSPPPPLPAPASKAWWFAWILSTVVIPGSLLFIAAAVASDSGVVALYGLGAIALLLHIFSSVQIGRCTSDSLTVFLLFGGWLLMGVSAFAGCVVLLSQAH